MDNIYSAYHYACKTKADKEAVEQIYEEVKKSAQNAIFRNIGDIFFTARTDTEINGAVECNGGTYSTADFNGKQNVGNLLANGSLPYVSLSEYESLVSANGSCRAFGWDGGDSFRVPLLNDVYIEAGTALTAGEFIAESLPNITGYFTAGNGYGFDPTSNSTSGAFSVAGNEGQKAYAAGSSTNRGGINFDASRSSSTYQDNAKVKPDSIRYRAMVQLANGATDQAVITATSALQQIANKVDKTSATDRETVVGWGMPDYDAGISIQSGITDFNEHTYLIPTDGVVVCYLVGFNGQSAFLKVNDTYVEYVLGYGNAAWVMITGQYKVRKGDVITYKSGYPNVGIIGDRFVTFYPMKGAN